MKLGRNAIRSATKISALPLIQKLSPPVNFEPNTRTLSGFSKAQSLARKAVSEVNTLLQVGWTESQTASLIDQYLQDSGVGHFFHRSFVWFGDRTRFEGVKNYSQYQPTDRKLKKEEIYILDVAPIVDGFVCDIGYTDCKSPNTELKQAKSFLRELRNEIPHLFTQLKTGEQIWNEIDRKIQKRGYNNIHAKYPFSVLGHRVHHQLPKLGGPSFLHFGWQSYWSLISRGLFGQLLSPDHQGDLVGLWAIEPHIGAKEFGAKFEEILVVNRNEAHWLEGEFGV